MFTSFHARASILAAALAFPALSVATPPLDREYDVRFQTLTLSNNDQADVYAPKIPHDLQPRLTAAFPVIALLQGALVDKSHYSRLGTLLAAQGFVVVIPNHFQNLPQFGHTDPVLFSQVNVVTEVLKRMVNENKDPDSALYRIVDTERMGLIGHSFGGAVAIDAAGGACDPIAFCADSYDRPAALKAAIIYGGSRIDFAGQAINRNTDGVAVAMLRGTLDGVATQQKAENTFLTLELPHAFISIEGANHYGLCDTNNPEGAGADPSDPTLDQRTANDLIARWSGLWLKSHLTPTTPLHH